MNGNQSSALDSAPVIKRMRNQILKGDFISSLQSRVVLVIGVMLIGVLTAISGWNLSNNQSQAQTELTSPAIVRVTDGSGIGQVDVAWQGVSGVTDYSVRWLNVDAAWLAYDESMPWRDSIQSVDIPSNDDDSYTITINGLAPGTNYSFGVGSKDGTSGDVDWSIWYWLTPVGDEVGVDIYDIAQLQSSALAIANDAAQLFEVGSSPIQSGITLESLAETRVAVGGHRASLEKQLDEIKAKGHSDRIRQVENLVMRLGANVDRIQTQRPRLLQALAISSGESRELAVRNATLLYPSTSTSLDSQLYGLLAKLESDGAMGSDGISSEELLAYTHLSRLWSDLRLGNTLLQIASQAQNPTYVARIQETYQTVSGRIERDLEYVSSSEVPLLPPGVIRIIEQLLEDSNSENDYFDRLENRLVLLQTEDELIEESKAIIEQLRVQLDAFITDIQGLPTPPIVAIPEADSGTYGISDDAILFGQSAALTGPSRVLGEGMQLGILAAFEEANRNGGVNGRQLQLTTLNDVYEPDFAFSNTRNLIENHQVFGLIGAVGTPTSRAASPLAHAAGVPFIGPFTGAQFLRDEILDNVFNVRASYHQETEEMVARLTEDLGITKVAVLYQNDSFGIDGLNGVREALRSRGMEPVASWYYSRNTNAVKEAVYRIADGRPEAVIIVGSHAPAVEAIQRLRSALLSDPVFMAVSFVGSNALAEALGDEGEGVYVTQVVPLPDDETIPVVASYRAALSAHDPDAEPGFVSLEGYLAGRLAIARLEACGDDLNRDCFLSVDGGSAITDIDGLQFEYGLGDNQGSDFVFLSVINADGEYELAENLSAER